MKLHWIWIGCRSSGVLAMYKHLYCDNSSL